MNRCPYCNSWFVSRDAADSHIVYMTVVVKDREHQSLTGFTSAAPTTWKLRDA